MTVESLHNCKRLQGEGEEEEEEEEGEGEKGEEERGGAQQVETVLLLGS